MDSPNSARFRLADRGDIPAAPADRRAADGRGARRPVRRRVGVPPPGAAAMNDHPPDPAGPGAPRPNEAFQHRPVMADEIVELFAPVPPGVLVDATVGGGGHAALLLAARPDCSLV